MAELRSYTPSWREKIAEGFSRLMPGEEDPWSVDMGHKLSSLADMLPPVGAFTYGNDAARSAQEGDYSGAAGNAAMAALSAVPIAGFNKAKSLFGRSPYAPIPGAPKTVNLPGGETMDAAPIPAFVDAASDYAKSRGMPHRIPKEFPKYDEAGAKNIAQWYDEAIDGTSDPATLAAYQKLAEQTREQYDALVNRGIGFEFMKRGPDGQVIDPYAAYGNPFFRAPGEERAWGLHSMMFDDAARPAMTAETRGQNSWVNAGPHGAHNKTASGADTIYADQKALKAPDWATNDPRLQGEAVGAFMPGIRVMGPAPAPLLDEDKY